MRIERWVTVGVAGFVLAACGGGAGDKKPISIASAAPTAAPPDASVAAAGATCLHTSARLEAKDVPYVSAPSRERLSGPVLEVGPNDYPNCKVAKIRVSVAATADDLSALGRSWSLSFNRWGQAAVTNTLIREPTSLRGSQLGSGCGTLVFEQWGPQFFGRDPPYDGTYSPWGGRSFEGFIGRPAAGKYTLYPTDILAPLTITCFVIDLEFQQD